MKIIVAQDCNCPKNTPNFTDEKKAARVYLRCVDRDENDGRMYWAVHYKGKHILAVEGESED